MFTYETIRLQRLSGAVVYNNAKACYKSVIENLSNLALIKQGLPTEIAKPHSQMFHQINYFIEHKLGIGNTNHSHNKPKPGYGVGQGSTDAPARWGFVCDPLLEIYKQLVSDAFITSPLSTTTTNNKISGFVDDTTALTRQHYSTMLFIILLLQKDTHTWERLIHTSGGTLAFQKCVFGPSTNGGEQPCSIQHQTLYTSKVATQKHHPSYHKFLHKTRTNTWMAT
jgi:hypothetical protein